MKKTMIMMGMLLPLALMAQVKYVIKGRLGNLSAPAKIYLSYQQLPDYSFIDDSAVLNNGRFEFKGTANFPVEATLYLRRKGEPLNANGQHEILYLFIENGVVTITGDSLHTAMVKGGIENRNYQQYRALLKPVKDKKWQLYTAKVSRDEYNERAKEIMVAEKAVNAQFIKTHPDSYVSFRLVRYEYGKTPNVEEVGPLYKLLSDRIKKGEPGKIYGHTISLWEKTKPGTQALDFTSKDTADKPVSLSDFKGKYVLLNFWSTTCAPCMNEKRHLRKTFATFKDRQFNILDVSMITKFANRDDKAAWLKLSRGFKLPWVSVYGNEAVDLYGVESVPQNFLISPDGIIIAHDVHGEALDKKLAELLNKN
jgi:peroxiredoxin